MMNGLQTALGVKTERRKEDAEDSKASVLEQFLRQHPKVKYLRMQWLDYGSILRVKLSPVQYILAMVKEGKSPAVPNVALALLPTDRLCPGFASDGEHKIPPAWESLKPGPRAGYASVQVEFQEHGQEVPTCPRTVLRRTVNRTSDNGREFLVGFEVEVVFVKARIVDGQEVFDESPHDQGHSWSSSRALHDENTLSLLEAILEKFEASSITVQYFHPECAPGQYEFALAPLAPLAAVDTLIAARDIIQATAARFSWRATLVPKPWAGLVGTGCHVHISMSPPDQHDSFLAGILKHLRAITAFTYGNAMSFQRSVDSTWAGGTYVAWGTQNRETPLRQIEGSHFELRCMDGFANPYLAMAAILGAGFQGVADAEPLTIHDCRGDPATLTPEEREKFGIKQKLPTNMSAAYKSLREDQGMRQILGKPFVDHYLMYKETELAVLEELGETKLRNWLIQRY